MELATGCNGTHKNIMALTTGCNGTHNMYWNSQQDVMELTRRYGTQRTGCNGTHSRI
jgi:hypothetical protein